MSKNNTTAQNRSDSARVVAEIVGVSPSLVHKVRSGDRNNDEVIAALIDYKKEKEKLIARIKQIQEIYREAARSGRYEDAYAVEEQIDQLQARFEQMRNQLIDEFYAG
jgi:vacuolar-type H+-ATPase subunit I/STV1